MIIGKLKNICGSNAHLAPCESHSLYINLVEAGIFRWFAYKNAYVRISIQHFSDGRIV